LIRPHRWKLLLIAGLLAAACSRPAYLLYEESLERAPESGAHAVHEQRLSELMESLDRLRSERLPQSLDLEVEEKRQARAIAAVARAMAESAAQIPQAIPSRLDDREQAEFRRLAGELQRQTERLIEEAPELTHEQRRSSLDEIDATCDDCHRQFRIPGRDHDGP
jgi:cytochrome c556